MIRRGADTVDRVPLAAEPAKPTLAVAFRRNQTYAVWDERGLTIRVGDRVSSTKLDGYPVSPRLFSRDEILANITEIQAGRRPKTATGLTGAQRLGNFAYFLVRWEDKAKAPWLEALVRVDLTSQNPKPELLGKFDGLSLARQPIDSHLSAVGAKLAVITRQAKSWGMSTYDPSAKAFALNVLGESLVSFEPRSGGLAHFTETTSYGTLVGGELNFSTMRRRTLFETRGTARFLASEGQTLALLSGKSGTFLRDTETGQETRIPAASTVRRVKQSVLVWSPSTNPTNAWLYDGGTWRLLAEWQAPKAK